jgi:hypothetical protein
MNWAHALLLAGLLGTAATAAAASRRNREAKEPTVPAEALGGGNGAAEEQKVAAAVAQEPGTTKGVAQLQTRDVTERLKSLRSEIVIEEEWTQLLKARLERMRLEAEISMVQSKLSGAGVRVTRSATALVPRPDADNDILVKGISTQPFKEAIITYKGRTYTVRPGDKMGPFQIKDITENGVTFTSGSRAMLGR